MMVAGGKDDGDFNVDGIVDVADLNVVGVNWQTGVGDAAAVPEPNSAMCAIISCLLAVGLLRRKNGNK